MRRREFITGLGGAVAAWTSVARAQQPAKMKRIAMVSAADRVSNMIASDNRLYRAFFDELGRLGFVEGKNLVFERYSGDGQPDRFAQVARDVVATSPDAIYAIDGTLSLAFKSATTTIPIVSNTGDPIASGLVSNVARPGGNVTGVSVDADTGVWGKRIGFLKEIVPKLSNVGLIIPRGPWERPYGALLRDTFKTTGISVNAALLDGKIDEAEYRRVFATFEQNRPDALLFSDQYVHSINGAIIVELAAKSRLPAIYTYREIVEVGGLMGYSFDLEELGRMSAGPIAKILNGTNPGEIPFYLASHYELALNLKTAKTLGLEFPATLLGSADLVIE